MQFLILIKGFLSEFLNNIPLALLLLSFYFFISYISYNISSSLYNSSKHTKYPTILFLFFLFFWVYGEMRSAGIIKYSYDTEGFVYSTHSFLGSIIVLFSTAVLLGNLSFWAFHHKVNK